LGFTKLDENIVTSSVWQEDDKTLRVWVYLMSQAGPNGAVEVTIPGIASYCRYDIATVEAILEKFAAPDKYSRTPEMDGRRIAIVREPEFAIYLINHKKYRDKDHTNAERQRRFRKQRKRNAKSNGRVTADNAVSHQVTQAEAEAEADNGSNKQTRARGEYTPKANPFIGAGERPTLEREALDLTALIAALKPDMDPVEIFRQAATYKGARTLKTNPANMSDDHLLNTLCDLKKMLAQARADKAERERYGNV
jgi:hypothetical protein